MRGPVGPIRVGPPGGCGQRFPDFGFGRIAALVPAAICRFAAAVIVPRAAPAKALAALSQMLRKGFFGPGNCHRGGNVPRRLPFRRAAWPCTPVAPACRANRQRWATTWPRTTWKSCAARSSRWRPRWPRPSARSPCCVRRCAAAAPRRRWPPWRRWRPSWKDRSCAAWSAPSGSAGRTPPRGSSGAWSRSPMRCATRSPSADG